MKNILIVGGAGYIGSHAVLELAKRGYFPITYDNLSTGHREAVRAGTFIGGDLNDFDRLEQVFRDYQIDAVMHFAASSLVEESVREPLCYYHNNVSGAINLLMAMHRFNVSFFIFSSTAAVYGEPAHIPITEESAIAPLTPYGRSKRMIEEIIMDTHKAFGLRYAILRYFNACGADPSGTIGEDHNPETHLIPSILKSIAQGKKVVRVFGTDYETPDGTCIRDYVHVSDLIDAHIRALHALEEDREDGIFNIGNGRGFSVREVIEAAQRVTGEACTIVETDRRPGDPKILVASYEKIERVLAWEPHYTDLESIIKTAWKWHRKQ